MNQNSYLKHHKKLSVWFDQTSYNDDQSFVSKIIYNLCEILKKATREDIKDISLFLDELSSHLLSNNLPQTIDKDFFEDILENLSFHEFDFYKFLTDISFASFEIKKASILYQSLSKLADLTKKDELLFLCAWISFNLNQHSACLLWLKKIKKQTAQTKALTGQVFLEMAEAQKALEFFEEAVFMDSSDNMSWFLLSKAAFCLDLYDKAWNGLMNCQKNSPHHSEVAIFCSILAKKCENKHWANISWKLLFPFLEQVPFSMETAVCLMELALILEDKKKLEEIIFYVPWTAIKNRPNQIAMLTPVLKDFAICGYYDMTQLILNQLV